MSDDTRCDPVRLAKINKQIGLHLLKESKPVQLVLARRVIKSPSLEGHSLYSTLLHIVIQSQIQAAATRPHVHLKKLFRRMKTEYREREVTKEAADEALRGLQKTLNNSVSFAASLHLKDICPNNGRKSNLTLE